MKNEYPITLGGKHIRTDKRCEIKDPYTQETIGVVHLASIREADEAIKRSKDAFEKTKRLPSYKKYEILSRVASILRERTEEISRLISREAGKPIRDSRTEVLRAINTFTIAAEESKRAGGEAIPLDLMQGFEGRKGITWRYPIAPILGITPFNFPLNLVAHKVAPCIAVGSTMILKPAPQTPVTSIVLADIVREAGYPEDGFIVLPCDVDVAEYLVRNDEIKMLSFTGSAKVGWYLKGICGKKKVVLELGGDAAVIVHNDAPLDYAIRRSVTGSFAYSGQICISVQRIYCHNNVYSEFFERFVEQTKRLKLGNPLDEDTDYGPMIDETAASKAEDFIEDARKKGGRIVTGGVRKGNFVEATVITDTRPDMKVCCEEAFSPIVYIEPYHDFDEAIKKINSSRYGLQAGVFTRDVSNVFKAFSEIDVGAVMINEIPTFRIDHMPYGGIKDSGLGREGIRYAMDEMTELKLLVLNFP